MTIDTKVQFIDYVNNLYDDDKESASIYTNIFGVYPSRVVLLRLTKNFTKKFYASLDLELLMKDYSFCPQNDKDLSKIIYLDKSKKIMVIEWIHNNSRTCVIHFSVNETPSDIITEAIKLSRLHQIRPPKKAIEPMIELVIYRNGELDTIRRKFSFKSLTNEELQIYYGKDFLPVYERLQEFLEVHRKLVLLHGQPGTGKSTLIKQLISQKNDRMLYFSPENLKLLGTPDFTKFLLGHTQKVIIAEDAENILIDSGTRSAATANILNLTDGILGEIYDCGLLATFNTHISNLDPALMRPGRLYLQHELRPLTVEECNIFFEFKNSPIRVTESKPLAELFHLVEESAQ